VDVVDDDERPPVVLEMHRANAPVVFEYMQHAKHGGPPERVLIGAQKGHMEELEHGGPCRRSVDRYRGAKVMLELRKWREFVSIVVEGEVEQQGAS
jgi:hypothetical protein